jgi:uncharacterized protein
VPYLDTSIVIAYYLPEQLSARAQEVYNAPTTPTISELVELEFFSALSRLRRRGQIEFAQAERVANLFLDHVQAGWYARIHLHAGHYLAARGFIARFDLPLKSPDALHLAVAAAERLPLITADTELARNAESLKLEFELIGQT